MRRERQRLRPLAAVFDLGMGPGGLQLGGARIGRDHRIEVRRECDRGLAAAGRHVHRKPAARRMRREPGEKLRRIGRPIPFIGIGGARKIVLESGRCRHRAIVAGEKNELPPQISARTLWLCDSFVTDLSEYHRQSFLDDKTTQAEGHIFSRDSATSCEALPGAEQRPLGLHP